MKRENERLSEILMYTQEKMEQHNKEVELFLKEVSSVRTRLVNAKALSRLAPIVQQLSIQGHIPNPFLPQTVHEVPIEHIRPSTPRPPLHPTNPDPSLEPSAPERPSNPVPPSVIITTPFVPNTPSPEPVPIPIPRTMDYTAGASRGPHHQPTPFEDDRHSEFPLLPTRQLMWGEDKPQKKKKPQGHQCIYCHQRGHWNLQCHTPHAGCYREGKCVVPLQHQHFEQACAFGGHMVANHPDPTTQYPHHRKQQVQPTDFVPSPIHSPTPNNTPTNNDQPPANSLLFSPNPPRLLDPLAPAFQPSPYQTTPPPGTWGNTPWGASWDDFAAWAHPPASLSIAMGQTTPFSTLGTPPKKFYNATNTPWPSTTSHTTMGSRTSPSTTSGTSPELCTTTRTTPWHPPPPRLLPTESGSSETWES